ncbi:hypothetical protein NV379_13430 [Paenibacillus sp. N1-5-1-14]|uniref:hypothetical protein n=1 Tax=Paenibacillus radicibacter TaxID=2972488 RepID=UPI0021595F54|nr:hypothetical protein [Paenibacillus radicibacter]MCR8643653.1 hypothetical protein [Paenibacillus radicibacter]
MSKIRIDMNQVNEISRKLRQEASKVATVESGVSSVKNSVDSQIASRRNIYGRLSRANSFIQSIDDRLNRLLNFTNQSPDKYDQAETHIIKNLQPKYLDSKKGISSLSQLIADGKFNSIDGLKDFANDFVQWLFDNNMFSDAYEKYNNTVGRAGDFMRALQFITSGLAMTGLGWSFTKTDDLFKFVMQGSVTAGRIKLPIGSFLSWIENSKLNNVARFIVNPLHFKYKDKSLAELLFKSQTKLLPSLAADLSNNSRLLWNQLKGMATSAIDLGAVKVNAGALAKNAFRVGKANAVSAIVITGVTEGIGAGIKITENYNKYGDDIEKLKEENAKAVGNAVYKTAVVSGASITGAVVFGAVGSLAGPIGTVVGSSVGSFVGSWVGDVFVSKTPGVTKWVENQAVKAKDTIHKGIEAVANGARSVKNGFKEVKEGAQNLLKSARSVFG